MSPDPDLLSLLFRNTTIRFVFVPFELLLTPQQFAVLVNCCALMTTSSGSRPDADAAGQHGFLELDLAAAHFADFERHVAAGPQHARQLAEHARSSPPASRPPCGAWKSRRRRVDAAEPSAQPVVAGVVTTSRNGGDVTTRLTELALSCGVERAGRVSSAARCAERSSVARVAASQSVSSDRVFASDERAHVAPRRNLLAARVDLRLRVQRGRLIRRQRVDGKEAGRVSGEPVDRHHANPAIDAVERAAAARVRADIRAARRFREACRGDRRPRALSDTTPPSDRSSAASLSRDLFRRRRRQAAAARASRSAD